MKTIRWTTSLIILLIVVLMTMQAMAGRKWRRKPSTKQPAADVSQPATGPMKTIAIGDVDAGYNMSGQKAYDVKETIQIGMKQELERIGGGRYIVKITSPAVVVKGSEEAAAAPTMPTNRVPTQAEMAKYMAHMQRQQQVMSGQVKEHKPVAADAFVEMKVESGSGSTSTSGAASTIGRFTGMDTSLGSMSTKTTRLYLVCTMRDPATGALEDRYTAKASSVEFNDIAGISTYNYGGDYMKRKRLFNKAIKKCAQWVSEKVR